MRNLWTGLKQIFLSSWLDRNLSSKKPRPKAGQAAVWERPGGRTRRGDVPSLGNLRTDDGRTLHALQRLDDVARQVSQGLGVERGRQGIGAVILHAILNAQHTRSMVNMISRGG